jgi:hypothetical protein
MKFKITKQLNIKIMKTPILKTVLAFFLLAICLSSCDSDDTSTPVVEPVAFNYAEGGELQRSVTNSAASSATKTIVGSNGTTNVVQIKLNSFSEGAYTIDATNTFKYTRPGQTSVWTAVSGRVYIFENTDGKISGIFDLTAGDSDLGINSVFGSFKNVVIN